MVEGSTAGCWLGDGGRIGMVRGAGTTTDGDGNWIEHFVEWHGLHGWIG